MHIYAIMQAKGMTQAVNESTSLTRRLWIHALPLVLRNAFKLLVVLHTIILHLGSFSVSVFFAVSGSRNNYTAKRCKI